MSYGMRLWLEGSGCTDTLAMNNEEDVKRLLEGVIRKAGMSLAKGPFCYREEQRDVGKGPGVTGVAILVESSAHIHTYPEQGYFFRSDHFPFAKAGVPAVSMDSGQDFIGRDEKWMKETVESWIDSNYHQPTDEYDESWDLSGSVQLAKFVLAATFDIANSTDTPQWNEGQEFKAARDRSLRDYISEK